MNRLFRFVPAVLLLGGLLLALAGARAETAVPAATPDFAHVPAQQKTDGRIDARTLGVFGPHICTAFGDPFSPLNSPHAPGLYTYQFQIHVPADYSYETVRVELFDPDSINAATENPYTITRTQAAVNAGLPLTTTASCGGSQMDPCTFKTSETALVDSDTLSFDQINPFWFVRLDEHRGTGGPPGSGACGNPGSYNPAYNTRTQFELAYLRRNDDGGKERVSLAVYTGQAGDGVRDNGGHLTDLHWVSPGADVQGPDYPLQDGRIANGVSAVPVDAGSAASFTLNLAADLPHSVVNPATGERIVHLDVTTLSGASENNFHVWAGPDEYAQSVPSHVNARNLHLRNNPGAHDAAGVKITANGRLPVNNLYTNPHSWPLVDVPAEFAGGKIYVTSFDTDSGAQPPLVFYFDTIAEADWSLTFGLPGVDDPDGVAAGVRCLPGSCDSQWIDPPYEIPIPGDLANCDYSDPAAPACIPFGGGRLMMRVEGGVYDSHGWEVRIAPPHSFEADAGCAAFPLAIHEGIRSVTPPGSGGAPYPDAAAFDYPPAPPAYSSFSAHQPDLPLPDARPGTVYKVSSGLGAGNFGWLVWNEGIAVTAETLANSLTWPGNTRDYSDYGDGGVALPGFTHVVRGYVAPGDAADTALHLGDWTAVHTGVVNTTAVRDALNNHVDLARTLRLLIWDDVSGSGGSAALRVSRFANFRLHGYSMSQEWLLLEFVSWDDSCGRPYVAAAGVTLSGPTMAQPGAAVTLTADLLPLHATQPVTYTWEASGQPPLVHAGGAADTAVYSWETAGKKVVTVTAVNDFGAPVSDTHVVNVWHRLYLPGVWRE